MAHIPDIRKECTGCVLSFLLEEFVKDSRNKSGYGASCKYCKGAQNKKWAKANPETVAKVHKKWRERNPEKVRELKADWRAQNREKELEYKRGWANLNKDKSRLYSANRRARKRSSDSALITESDLQKMYSKNCIYCGALAEQIDHIIPLARGGRHAIGNLAPSCANCNQSKGSKFIMEWKLKDKV